MKSLGDIFRDALHHHADRQWPSHSHNEESSHLLLRQKAGTSEKDAAAPTRQEVVNYLGQLADDYQIPRKLVYAVADA